jgi:hypothetical protein
LKKYREKKKPERLEERATSRMNIKALRQNINHTLRFAPAPRRDTANGRYMDEENLWILRKVNDVENLVTFENLYVEGLSIEPVHIKSFDKPDTATHTILNRFTPTEVM